MFGLRTKTTPSEKTYKEGIITEIVHQKYRWRVSFDSTYWFAKSEQAVSLNPGDLVSVVGRESATTLLVKPI